MTAKKKEPAVVLNPDQQAGFDMVKAGENVFFTGPAGTGKSVLLRAIREAYPDLQVTGSTGIAALGVNGCTLHSWAGFGISESETAAMVAKKHNERKNSIWHSIRTSERLAIDEISMVDGTMLDKLDMMLKIVRKNHAPFGGLKLVLFGDFLQLPPVGKDGKAVQFAFESRSWAEANIRVHVLTKAMRQADKTFADVLSRVRLGDVSEDVRSLLRPRIGAVDPMPQIIPVTIATHNNIADAINNEHLAKLTTEAMTWTANDDATNLMHAESLDRNCIAPKTLVVKLGCQVMLLKNIDQEAGLVNGSLGVITEFRKSVFGSGKVPIVKFTNGITRELDRQSWQILRGDKVLASRSQFPLRLAYAITAHKAQGMTLEKIRVHLKRCFADGQGYTAISRVKTIEGLFIVDIDGARPFRANATALEFYRRHAA